MIDFKSNAVFSLLELTGKLPRNNNGRKISISTIHRWIVRGVRGVKLSSVRIGGRRYVTARALSEFLAAAEQVDVKDYQVESPAPQTSEGPVEKALEAEGL
jgi:hypothetical protein